MAVKTTLERLEEVQATITEVMTSQELGGPSGRLVRAQLAVLLQEQKDLLVQYRIEQGTGGPARNIGIPRREY